MADSTAARDRPSNETDDTTGPGGSSTGAVDGRDEFRRLERAVPGLAEWIRTAGFWSAIALPFVHVPILLSGLDSRVESGAFCLLLAANLLALYVGHPHRR